MRIGVLDKFVAAVAIKSRKPPAVSAGVLACWRRLKMGGKPQRFYSDEEGSFNSPRQAGCT